MPFSIQEGLCDLLVEYFDQRAHEEGGDDGADADLAENLPQGEARQSTEDHAADHAEQVCDDTADGKRDTLLLLRPDQGHGVVGGDAQVRGEVEGGGQAHDDDGGGQQRQPQGQRRLRQQPGADTLGELGDIAQQEQVDEGRQADLAAVEQQGEQQQHQVGDHVQRAEVQGNHSVQAAHQRLEGIDAEAGVLEHAHADAADDHADGAHQDAPEEAVGFFHGVHSVVQRIGAAAPRGLIVPQFPLRGNVRGTKDFWTNLLTFRQRFGMICKLPVGTTTGSQPGEMAELVEGARLEIV